jgi:hypothetical protein
MGTGVNMTSPSRPRRGSGLVGARLVAVAALTVLVLPGARASAPEAPAAAEPARQLYWGAYVSGGPYGQEDAPWDMTSLDRFEEHAGKRVSLLEWGEAWYSENSRNPGYQDFPTDHVSDVRARGAIPVISWGPYDDGEGSDQPEFRLRKIIDGDHDEFIRDWAQRAKDWGHPFFLRFAWEMNTRSAPYSEAANGNDRGEFAEMWRHVHGIFTDVGATNATWVWCPNVNYDGSLPFDRLFPGDAYVDWVCLDGYNWGTNPARPGSRWRTFNQVFRSSYEELLELAPGAPVMIGETAATEYGGSKAAWITEAFRTQLRDGFPEIRAVVWFNKNADGMDWIIESSDSATQAFAKAIGASSYAENRFGDIDTSPIPPPEG